MKVSTAFDTYQGVVNAAPEAVTEARRRRNLFKAAFADETVEVRASGSLARGTQHDPIKDVDTILVFDTGDHPDWGQPGQSAQDALDHVSARTKELLGTDGTHSPGEVRLIKPRNHAVKCFLDEPKDPDPFTVDAMPALRLADGTLLVPEARSEDWIVTNPGYLIDEALRAHKAGGIYAPMVRVLKRWRRRAGVEVKSLLIEVLALECMPKTGTRQDALSAFFTTASVRINEPVCDPAGLCGEIQPGLDALALRARLEQAADIAASAVAHEGWDQDDVAVRLWGELFGPDFPKPPGGGGGSGGGLPAGGGAGALAIPKRTVKDINQG